MATWKKIITSGSIAELSQLTASVGIKVPNDSIPIASLAEDAITIAGTSTALGGSITADTIAGQISADTISGNQINGGTIGSVTISALAGALSLGDNNITNVGDINADSISVDAATAGLNIDFSAANTGTSKLTLRDNMADALNITEGSNSYIKFTTTNSSEKILVSKDTDFVGNISGSTIEGQILTADVFLSSPSASITNLTNTNITASGNISGSLTSNLTIGGHATIGAITASSYTGSFVGDGSNLTGVGQDIDTLNAFSGVPHATQDEFLISDNGTELRATMTMVANGGFALVSGDATIAAGGALTIAATAVENGMLADNAVDTEEIADDAVTTAKITDANVTLAKIANAAANTVIVRDANSSGVLSAKAVTNTQILIGDGTGFTAAALSGDVTMTNAGVTSVADNKIGNDELKQDDDITLQSLTTTNNVTIGGDLTVNGSTTTIATTNTKVEDQLMFLGTGSAASNKDIGILAQSGSADLSGSAFYHDTDSERWSVAKGIKDTATSITPLQFVTTVKTDTVNPDATSGSYGAGEMHVNTDSGEIWIRFG